MEVSVDDGVGYRECLECLPGVVFAMVSRCQSVSVDAAVCRYGF